MSMPKNQTLIQCPFDLTNKKRIIEFDKADPYNPQNRLRGFVNRREGQLYGSLWITHVNDEPCEQLIYSAPKQHYPFDKDNNWEFPEFDEIELYEKLDGTCIISYNYHDNKGNTYLTYKTRLRPFLSKSRFGNFYELWNEMRDKYPDIDLTCRDRNYNYVFELFGKRNKILIDYDVPLDTRLLFYISTGDGTVFPPILMPEIPTLIPADTINDITPEKYNEIKDKLEEELFVDEENKILQGKEGYVMYFIKDGAVQIKNKPPSVLKYHWSGDAISFESIYTTVINAFENFDEPSFDDVVRLLQEEFDDEKIAKSRVRIEKILGRVLFDKKFQYKLAEDYKKLGIDINKDKATVMHWFGQNYPKSEAHRIFNLLKSYENS